MWSYLAGDAEQENFEKIDALFTRQHPDVAIRQVLVPLNAFAPKLLAAAATGDGPDVIIGNPVVDFPLLSQAPVYADLTQRWAAYPDRGRFSETGLWRDGAGRLKALQWRFNDLGLWYNADVLREEGLAVPRTVPEFESALATIGARGQHQPLVIPGDPSVQSAWTSMAWMLNAGVTYCTLDDPAVGDVLSRMVGWVQRGYIPAETSALDLEDAFDRFLTGDYAFAVGGNWEVGKVRSEPPDFEYGTARLPAGGGGHRMSFAGESVGVGQFSGDPDLAWDYVRTSYLSRDAQLTTFRETGALPPRLDLRAGPEIGGESASEPFLAALAPEVLVPWPTNPRTLDAQTDVGALFSSLFSGELSGGQAAREIRATVHESFEDGGGGC